MKIGIAQFAAAEQWQQNLETCTQYYRRAVDAGVDLLVFPEGVLARFTTHGERIRAAAQPLDGPFVDGLRELTARTPEGPDVVVGIHEPGPDGRVFNTLVVLRAGEIVTTYRKLHLYDAFAARESDNVIPSDSDPRIFSCRGVAVGLMTCYDLRFPELARLLAVRGAEAIVLPAAWVKGPLKERHWETLIAARALENTVYVAGVGECGPKNIGESMVADPLGMPILRLDEQPGFGVAEISLDRLGQARRELPVLANRRFDVNPQPRPIGTEPSPSVDHHNQEES